MECLKMKTGKHIGSICIIIPTFNRRDYLFQLLLQIGKLENRYNVDIIPVIVVDGCTDDTCEMLAREFPSYITLRGPGGWWWTKCINEGMKYAICRFCPDYLLLLNDDSQIHPDYLNALIESAYSAGDDSIIGSISVTDNSPLRVTFSGVKSIDWTYYRVMNYHRSFELLENIPPLGLYPSFALNGRGSFFSAKLILEVGFLNEHSFPQYGSDDDLALRAWKKGFLVFISYSCIVFDRTQETAKGTAFRQDRLPVFLKSFFTWNSVNYLPKQMAFFYLHGKKKLLPFYLLKFIAGTCYAYFFKYKNVKHDL